MSANLGYPRIQRILSVIAGIVLIGGPFIFYILFQGSDTPVVFGAVLVMSGCAFIGLALIARHERVHAALTKASLVVLSLTFVLAVSETIFRTIGFNFDAPASELPICQRSPTFHAGDGILRRPGPASWRGKPLSSFIHYIWGNENAYPDEREIVINYDRLGFRNPPDLMDWEVVVTGDSFVESGYLAYEDVFTTLAAKRLGVRIKNLGVSGTGTIFQTAYVRNYGQAPSTRHAVLCFFDGNDVMDLFREARDTNSIRRTGHRMGQQKQSSLFVAIGGRLRHPIWTDTRYEKDKLTADAVLLAGTREYPLTTWPIPPPRWEDLKKDRQELVTAALAEWGRTVRSLGMQPWVMCIPDSRRVFEGHIRTNHPMAHWRSGQFGPHLGKICSDRDIRFIDTFPPLRRAVEAGQVPYNIFGDAHLNAHGSSIVADVLVEALRAEVHKRE